MSTTRTSSLNALRDSFSFRKTKQQLAYFRSIPNDRLVILAIAMFLVVAALGLFTLLLETNFARPSHPMVDVAAAAYIGLAGAIYVLCLVRQPRWWPLAAVFYAAGFYALFLGLRWYVRNSPAASAQSVIHMDARLGIGCTLFGYTLFLLFIQTEGMVAFRAHTELALAHTIQHTLVPVIHLKLAGCEIYGVSSPSEKVGGDLVDVLPLPDGSAVAYVADIAGHGLNAGILMGMLKAAARASITEASEPDALFENLNRVLPGVKEAHMYATCAAFRLRPCEAAGCDVQYAIAAHPPVLHLSAAGEARPLLTDEQFPLGLLPSTGYRCHSVFAAAGDLLLAATDGVLEVAGKDGAELGVAGLSELVRRNSTLSLPALAESILAAIRTRGKQEDDQTLLLIRVL
jgi:hypothetical protein